MRTVLIFPHKGSPPKVPEGYEAEVGDPFVLHMVWMPCKYRGILTGCGACPSNKNAGPPYCNLKDIIVDQNTCRTCTEEDKT